MRTFAVPAPGVEMAAQVLDITGRFKPDFVIAHLFGRSPSVAIKELKGKGYPLSKVIGFVWASSEADINAAGGFGVAEGYHTHAVRRRRHGLPGHQATSTPCTRRKASRAPKEQEISVLLQPRRAVAAIHVEAIRNAIKAKGGAKPTGEDVKKGMEPIKDFTLGGLVPPHEDHAGRPRRRRLGADLDRSRAASSSRTASGSRPIAT